MNKNWIKDAVKEKGALRKALKIKEGKLITESKLDKALHSTNSRIRKESNLAKTLRRFKSRGK